MANDGRRRSIEIPAELLGDELAVARHVVSAPDVVLLVDGDPVARLGWPELPLVKRREALVVFLAELAAFSEADPDVVFDGNLGAGDLLPPSRSVRIRLSTPPTEPIAAIDELVDAYPATWPLAVVTGSELASAADRGVTLLANAQLLDLLVAGGGSPGRGRRAGALRRFVSRGRRQRRRASRRHGAGRPGEPPPR